MDQFQPPESDPRRTFQADQEAARTEQEAREAQTWSLNVRQSEAQVSNHQAHTVLLMARATLWRSIAFAIRSLVVFAAIFAVLYALGVLR